MKTQDIENEKIKQKSIKAVKHHLDNIDILSKREPSTKELKKMYGYLASCWRCDKRIFLGFESYLHSFEGNSHRFGCGFFGRLIGFLWHSYFYFFQTFFFIILFIIIFKGVNTFLK